MEVQLKVFHRGATIPEYHSKGASAFDLHACLEHLVCLHPGQTEPIPTGLGIYLEDPNYGIFVWERSGLGKAGMQIRGGVVDSDYQGELFILLTNGTDKDWIVMHGDRLAQAVITPIIKAEFKEVKNFSSLSERGSNAFGSTGR